MPASKKALFNSNLNKSLSLTLILHLMNGLFVLSLYPSPVQAAHFLDTDGNWAEAYINILSDKGIIPAEETGKFRPSEPITRAQLASWLVKVLGLESQPVPEQPSFADVKASDSYFRAVEIIRQNNFISGYADGFRPNQFIQKGEVITILARALNKPAPDETQIEDELAKYKDATKVPGWARVGVAESSLAGVLLVGPDVDSIGADKLANRADTAALIYKLDEYLARRQQSAAVNQASKGYQQAAPNPNSHQGPGSAPSIGNSPEAGAGDPQSGTDYQGQVNKGDYFHNQSPYSSAYSQAPPQFDKQGPGQAPGQAPLQGGVVVLSAGTRFRAQLKNSINSASTQVGEEIRAVINEPIYGNGAELIPAGSVLIGEAGSVTPAARFKAGANGKMEIRFSSCETPDGRRIPFSASVDIKDQRMTGGSTAGRVGKGLVTTGVGAASGAALGTALGAIVGGTSNANVGTATGMGAVFGTAIGAGIGGVGALVRKGADLKLPAGLSLPLVLDQSTSIPLAQPGKRP